MSMTVTKTFSLCCGAALSALVVAGSAAAHDPKGKGGMPMIYQKRVMEGMKALEKADNSDQAKGMYSRMVQWPPSYAKLRVCFMGGNPATNAKVAKISRFIHVSTDEVYGEQTNEQEAMSEEQVFMTSPTCHLLGHYQYFNLSTCCTH